MSLNFKQVQSATACGSHSGLHKCAIPFRHRKQVRSRF